MAGEDGKEVIVDEVVDPAAPPAQPDPPEQPAPPADAAPPAPAPKPEDWRDARIRQLTAKLREEQAKAPPPPKPNEAPAPQLSQEEFNRRVEEEAGRRSAAIAFNQACNDVAKAGRGAYQDFDQRATALRELVDLSNPADVATYQQFLSAAIETGEGAKVLYELGGNLNEAQRMLAMPPARMAVELTKLSLGGIKQVSELPKPIVPIGSRGSTAEQITPDDVGRADKLSTAEWMRRRNAQVAAREAAEHGERRR